MTNDFDATKPYIIPVIEHLTSLKAKKTGEQFFINPSPCCKHNDCFSIKSNDTGHFYKCHSCGEGGTVHDYIQKRTNLSLSEGLKLISDLTGYQLQSRPGSTSKNKSNSIYEAASKYYQKVFWENSEKQKYQLEIRCHTHETLKSRMIGLTDRRLHIYLKKEDFAESEMLASGLVKKENGHIADVFNFSGMFVNPQVDINGHVGHFTIKDPRSLPKDEAYHNQLKNEFKNPEITFDNMPAFKQDNIYIVEGENDVNTMFDIGINNVVGTNGQLSEKQLYYIKDWLKSERQKEITLIFDNDDAGKGYTEKFIAEFQSNCFVDLLKSELRQQNLILKIITLDKCKDIDEYLVKKGTDTKKKKKLFRALESKARRYLMPLKQMIKLYTNHIAEQNESAEPGNKVKPNNIFIGKLISEYFNIVGTFFVEPENDYMCSIFYKDSFYRISDNRLFNALINREAGLNASQNGFKIIRQEIEDFAINNGQKVNIPGWISSKISLNTIYINLCNDKKQLLKLYPGNIEIIQNGSNTDGILLKEAPNLSGIEYVDDIELKQGMSRLKAMIFDNQACSEANKYYVFVFLLATFLVDFINAKGILKASGDTSSGKTTAARLLTCLLFKKDMTSTGTVASYYTEAATSPMLIMDNLESKDITTALLNFILIVATGGQRIKRSKDSQTANVYEKPNTQIFWSAIEPPEKEETLNRTIDIEFSRKYWDDNFTETETMELIKEERNRLLSTIFNLIAFKILPDFTQKRKKAQTWIKNKYKGHAKERLNELLATYLVILKEVCAYIPYSRQEDNTPAHMTIFNQWIDTQNEIAKHTAMNTNPILRYLGYLLKYYTYHQSDFDKEFPEIQVGPRAKYDVNVKEFKKISFDFTYSDLLAFIGRASKRIGEKNPFGTAAQLRYRLKNSQKILQDANWIYEGESKRNSQARYYRITKKFETEKEPF